ncbi:MAG: hypothetical protein AB4206_12420 [Xenococcaceae cyanobacterium]
MSLTFDPTAAQKRIAQFWSLSASFGMERNAYHNYLNEIVSDRYVLIKGLQILRDELQFGENPAQLVARAGALNHYQTHNLIHRRIRGDLGERNFQYLANQQILTEEISYKVQSSDT